jgi:Fe2+ transport system protein FeoA
MISLSNLAPRQKARIYCVSAETCECCRLTGLGICQGRIVEMIKPGDPMIVRVYGVCVGISSRLADCIEVEPIAAESAVASSLTPAHASAG